MANPKLSPDQVGVLMNEGTFRGLKKLLQTGQITEAHGANILAKSYETLLGQVKEAKREMQRVQTALQRPENLLTIGKQSRKPLSRDTTHSEVGVALMAFDGGW